MVIAVYGLGALGSNLLVQLAKQFPDTEFHGIDFDKVEDRNIRTQAYFLEHVGMHKSDAMRIILARYLRKPNYKPFRLKIERPEMIGRHDLAIDCFDNTASRELFREVKSPVLHIGFSPAYSAECMWNKEYFEDGIAQDVDPALGDICSMTEAVSFIHYIVNLSAMNITQFLTKKVARNFVVTHKTQVKWL